MDRVRLVWTGVPGAPYYTNFYFTAALDSGGATALIDAVQAMWTPILANLRTDMIGTIESEVVRIDSVTGDAQSSVSGGEQTIDPTGAGEPLPTSLQGLIRLRTAAFVSGRRINGRLFVPGLVDLNNANGVPSSGLVTVLGQVGNALVNTEGVEWGVWSRKNGTFHPIIDTDGWSQFGVLRSRRD